jgi:hypothetical protein
VSVGDRLLGLGGRTDSCWLLLRVNDHLQSAMELPNMLPVELPAADEDVPGFIGTDVVLAEEREVQDRVEVADVTLPVRGRWRLGLAGWVGDEGGHPKSIGKEGP